MKKAIFFVGNRFSGEELLTEMLNLHPEVSILQGTAFGYLVWRSCNGGVEENPVFDTHESLEMTLKTKIDLGPLAKKEVSPNDFWSGLFAESVFAGGECAPQQMFPGVVQWFRDTLDADVRLIHCMKNPLHRAPQVSPEMVEVLKRDTMSGGTEFSGEFGRLFKGWMMLEQAALVSELHAPSVWVREEDLLVDPMIHVGRVLTHLGLSFPEDGQMGRGVQRMAKAKLLMESSPRDGAAGSCRHVGGALRLLRGQDKGLHRGLVVKFRTS